MTEFIEFRGKMRTREAIAYIEAAERGEDPTAAVPVPVDDTPKAPAPRTSTFPAATQAARGGTEPLRPRNVTPDGKTVILDKDSKPVGEPFEEKLSKRPPLVIPTIDPREAESFVVGRESEPVDPKPAPGQAGFEGEV